MSYMKIGNHRIRENGHKRNIFDKVNEIKRDIKSLIPELECDKLLPMMSHIRLEHEGKLFYGRRGLPNRRKRVLTANERILYDYFLSKGLSPSTTYRWFLATRIPEDIQEKLAKGKLSYRKAMQIAFNRKHSRNSSKGLLLLEELKITVRGL